MNGQCAQDGLELRRGAKGKQWIRRQIAHRFRGCAKHLGHALRVHLRLEVGQPGGAGRCQCEGAEGLDDPIEFEGPEHALVHICVGGMDSAWQGNEAAARAANRLGYHALPVTA